MHSSRGLAHQGDSCNCGWGGGWGGGWWWTESHRGWGRRAPQHLLLQNAGLDSCSVLRLRAFIFAAPSCCPRPCSSEIAQIPQVRRLHLRIFARLFTAEVRPVIAETENSFFSLAFIYTLIKEPFAHGGMAARGIGR